MLSIHFAETVTYRMSCCVSGQQAPPDLVFRKAEEFLMGRKYPRHVPLPNT